VLRDVFGAEREEVTGDWKRLHDESFMILTVHQISPGQLHLVA
jgi:hypothetical protein